MTKHSGGCLCGIVRFELSTNPEIVYGCHCRFCQRSTGTAFRSGMRCKKENVTFNDAELKTYIYTSHEHGRSINVHFCPICATTVKATTDRFPEAQVMMLGTLDDPSAINVEMHMFTDEGMKWVSFGEADTVYSKHRLKDDGSPATPIEF